jgi:GTPase SAR1 family protein
LTLLSKVFFSPRALYLVVWDMTQNTPSHFDEYVQFWVDLIQIRAPGSTIIIVGTKSDLIRSGSPEEIITRLSDHLKGNEKKRLESIKREIKRSRNTPLLQRLLKQRPIISQILPVSCTKTLLGFNELTKVILELSTPGPKNIHPFQLVNIEIPRFYLEVKEEVESMLQTCSVTNMNQLHQNMIDRRRRHTSTIMKERAICELSINDTRDAVTFLSSIGEVIDSVPYSLCLTRYRLQVVWFGSTHKGSHRKGAKGEQMEVVAVEIFPDFDECGPPEPLSILSLRNQNSVTSVQSDVSFNGGFESEFSDTNNCSSSYRTTSGAESDTWRDVGGSDSDKNHTLDKSDNDRSNSSKTIPPTPRPDDLSDIIFLSPHWLLQSMKKILTHHLEADIQSIL